MVRRLIHSRFRSLSNKLLEQCIQNRALLFYSFSAPSSAASAAGRSPRPPTVAGARARRSCCPARADLARCALTAFPCAAASSGRLKLPLLLLDLREHLVHLLERELAVLVHLRRLRYLRFQLTVSGQRVISLALRVHFLQPEMAEREWHRLRVDLRRDR